MDKHYEVKKIEEAVYLRWLEENCFAPHEKSEAENFSLSIPPPNVTGRLHIGHALNGTLQDALVRYKRMDGFNVLWVPGVDHAGIATQSVVKKMLDEKGIDYREMGRERFVEEVWKWKDKYGAFIIHQFKKLGVSCDWSRERFTMDKGFSAAVKKAFCQLYQDGLVYRGNRMVNWCPQDRTALSDDEIDTKEENGFLWYLKYQVVGSLDFLTVATTRPETLFGDTALAVNPEDERFSKYIGRKVRVPLCDREVEVIGDEYVDKNFGTGCLKVTPAHDKNDFEIGKRHGLDIIDVMNEDATMNENALHYRGLDRYVCRKRVLEELKEKGLLIKEEPHKVPLQRSYRSKEVIEYRLSLQWFVKMKPLCQRAIDRHSEIKIVPSNWERVYLSWLNNIEDWCISRQIWWGHRIPAWYHRETGEILVSEEDNPKEVASNPEAWLPEEDVLDTWFSSALWPMGNVGWPEKTRDFEKFFPNSVLFTAKDILFFWVARMNFMSLYLEDKMPYKQVFIHPVVLDGRGMTMSKSKGNGIDPVHVIEGASAEDLKAPIYDARPHNMKQLIAEVDKHHPNGFEGVGADSLRYTLVQTCSSGQEIKVALEYFVDIGRRYVTKLWNASRFFLEKMECDETLSPESLKRGLRLEDKWIQYELSLCIQKIREGFDKLDFSNISRHFYDFFWANFCDWYLEIVKPRLSSGDPFTKKQCLFVGANVLKSILKLKHPVIPFVTEEIWSSLVPMMERYNLWDDEEGNNKSFIMLSSYPKELDIPDGREAKESIDRVKAFITAVRTLRSDYGIKEDMDVAYIARHVKVREDVQSLLASIKRMAKIQTLQEVSQPIQGHLKIVERDFEIYVDIKRWVQVEEILLELNKNIQGIREEMLKVSSLLENPNFIGKASQEKIAQQHEAFDFLRKKEEKLTQTIEEFRRIL